MTLPQAAVALVSSGEDMGRQLTQPVLSVQLYGIHTVQTWDGFVGIYWCQDGTNVCLRGKKKTKHRKEMKLLGKKIITTNPDPEISYGEGESLNKDVGLQQRAPQFGKEGQTPEKELYRWVWMGHPEFCCFILLSLLN